MVGAPEPQELLQPAQANVPPVENPDWRLRRDRPGHTVESVPLMGWAGLKIGARLAEAKKRFDALPTMDGNRVHPQDLARFQIAVIALQARRTRLADTRPSLAKTPGVSAKIQPGTLTLVS